jgi:hypothetical protein
MFPDERDPAGSLTAFQSRLNRYRRPELGRFSGRLMPRCARSAQASLQLIFDDRVEVFLNMNKLLLQNQK